MRCGGNFCAGYDLKELANHTASLKSEQDVPKGPGPMDLSRPLIAAVGVFAVAGVVEDTDVPSQTEVIRKSWIHIKLNRITLMGGHCSGLCFDVVRIPAAPAAHQNSSHFTWSKEAQCVSSISQEPMVLTERPIGAQDGFAHTDQRTEFFLMTTIRYRLWQQQQQQQQRHREIWTPLDLITRTITV
ncbi:hypothetical protein EYF80_005138 [Liparis tanakae]|uniref:Uncharacterized protein n=1 Tax=Liparis tanakae TaxID=230148 RepID=A0A4Z2J5D3_9TELE|nr:hypothetical protein EYF80_005138 [Liparis tanakae]